MIMKKSVANSIMIAIGPIIFLSCIMLLPQNIFPALEMRAAVGTVAWMAFWWVSSCIDYAVTAFVPIIINSLIAMSPMNTLIANYSSEIIMLLLGASFLTISWEIVGLDKRIAYAFLALIGSSLTSQIIFWFLLSVVMSALLPNSIVCATITPIAVSMLRHVGIKSIKDSAIGSIILLTIVWGTGLGGLASPLGGAMNLVIIDYIEQLTGTEFLYMDWVIKLFPVMITLILSNLIFILAIKPKGQNLDGSKAYFVEKNKQLGKISREELICLVLFLLATLLSFTRSFYSDLLPGLKPAYVFIICGISTFLLKNRSGERIMLWKNAQKKVGWELIYVFAGGLAAGTIINESGSAQALAGILSTLQNQHEIILIFVIILLTITLSDFTSNTATAAVAMPIVLSLAVGMELNPIPYIFAASVGVNLSYCMPTSIRAIPVGYGLSPSYMFRHGIKLTLIVIAIISLLVWLLMKYWPFFSITM